MKVEVFRNREGKIVAAAEIGPEGSARSHFEPLEKTAGTPHALHAAAAKASEIVEGDLSDPEAFFLKHQG
jgi:hypothetical protein